MTIAEPAVFAYFDKTCLFAVAAHGPEQLNDRGFLIWRQADPAVEQLLHLRRELHHFRIGKKLGHCDAKAFADRLEGRNRGNRIPPENVSDRRLRQAAFF